MRACHVAIKHQRACRAVVKRRRVKVSQGWSNLIKVKKYFFYTNPVAPAKAQSGLAPRINHPFDIRHSSFVAEIRPYPAIEFCTRWL
jgi:hypothetical protein